MNQQGPFDGYHFVISHELLKLLEWLMDHEQESLGKLVKRIVHQDAFIHAQIDPHAQEEDLQQSIVDFFAMLDSLVNESLHNEEAETIIQRLRLPALDNLDTRLYDAATVATSIEKATQAAVKAEKSHKLSKKVATPKDVLCKELLRRWKPHKSSVSIN